MSGSTLEEEVVASSNGGSHTLEVLQGLTPTAQQQTAQNAIFFTQPTTNPAISLTGTNLASDHIIVHMLPVNQAHLEAVSMAMICVQSYLRVTCS